MPEDRSGHVPRLRRLMAFAVVAVALCHPAGSCLGQTVLEDLNESSKFYLITLSGLVGKSSFQRIQGVLTLAAAPPGAMHAYVVTISGWPQTDGENTFVWNSEDSSMDSLLGRVTCRIVNAAGQASQYALFFI